MIDLIRIIFYVVFYYMLEILIIVLKYNVVNNLLIYFVNKYNKLNFVYVLENFVILVSVVLLLIIKLVFIFM